MSPEQEQLVHATWAGLACRRRSLERAFRVRLAGAEPELGAMLDGLAASGVTLVAVLDEIVAALGDSAALVEIAASTGRRLAVFGITRRDHEAVAAALMWALETTHGEGMAADEKRAWRTLLALLSGTMWRAGIQESLLRGR